MTVLFKISLTKAKDSPVFQLNFLFSVTKNQTAKKKASHYLDRVIYGAWKMVYLMRKQCNSLHILVAGIMIYIL